MGGSPTQYVREISVIDPRQKKLTMKSINLTMSHIISCEETVTYQEDPADASRFVLLRDYYFHELLGHFELAYSYWYFLSYLSRLSDKSYRTVFTQSAAITAGSTLSRMAGYIEDFSVKRFQQNAAVGRQGFQMVLERFAIMAEGSTETAASDRA